MYQFALIGCGRIASRHAENIQKVGKLIAVCDVVPEKASQFATQYQATAYTSCDDLLFNEKEVEIVCVCSPNGLHAEHTIKSLQARKHVLCEKPMCLTPVAAWQMVNTAHFFRKSLFVVKQNRYNPPVQFVKSLLQENKLGRILSFQINCFWNRPQAYYTGDWRGTNHLDGGLLYTQFSHFIDLLYWFLGDVEQVTGWRQNSGTRQHLEFEDTGVALLHMKNNALGTLHYTINSYQKNSEGSFTLFGEKGTVKIGGQYLNTLEWQMVEGEKERHFLPQGSANDYGFYTGSMSNHDKVYQDLIKALQQKENSLPEDHEAVKTIEIIEKIYAATGFTGNEAG